MSISSNAAGTPIKKTNATLIDYLSQEQTQLTSDIDDAKQQILPKDQTEFTLKMQRIVTMLTITQAKMNSLEGFLDNQNKQLAELNQKLKNVQQLPLANAEQNIIERVARIEKAIALNKKTSELINTNRDLTDEFQKILDDNVKDLEAWNVNFKLEQKLLDIKNQRIQLNKNLNALYETNGEINKQLVTNPNEQITYEAKKLVTNHHIALIQNQLNALTNQKRIIKAKIVLLENSDSKSLQYVTDTYTDVINQYAKLERTLQQMNASLDTEARLNLGPSVKKSMNDLQSLIKKQLHTVTADVNLLTNDLGEYQNKLKKIISARQSLSEYRVDGLTFIVGKIVTIPTLFYTYIKTLSFKVYDSYLWLNTLSATILWTVLVLITGVFYLFNRFLKLSGDKERSRLTGYLYDGILTLIQRNIPYLCFFSLLWASLFFTNVSFSSYQLLFNLILVWIAFRVFILIARLALLERISDSSGQDVTLYYRLKWLLLFGGWTTALMTFSHLLPLPVLLQDIFNRLFMLFILTVSLVAWKSRDVIPDLLSPLLKTKKRYVKRAISLLVFIVPITLFITAMIGLSGFVNLSWTMSRYEGYVLMVLVGYILTRGLLFDALELLSEWMISSLRNGWLWIEVFLKPLDTILRIVLLSASVCFLFQLFGWHSDSPVVIQIRQAVFYPLVQFPGIHITVASILAFIALVALFTWASRWTREFCYRWLFTRAKDAGVRNSLSVFTQYAVVLIGGVITLHVLGLDFTGMSMILGGLAVGMGFGLRDFASNIVGGVMLLIERPVREGDLITIGEYEGQVSHIGIRSMRVSSWDNTEVLIPNAETFNKPFINWTHQDGIVRTVIPIKVSRADDPIMVQQLILDVLAIIPEIEPDPPAQVFLKKIDEALIEFEARYFINVHVHTRFEVRSKVLFAITAQFNAANIKAPIEPIAVEFKEGQGYFVKNTTTA